MSTLAANLIWATVVIVLVLPFVLILSRAVRNYLQALTKRIDNTTADDTDTVAQVITNGERQLALELHQSTLAERVAAEQARLRAETAQHEVEAKVADASFTAAIEARKQVLAARAEAEVTLAEEYVRSQWHTPDPQGLASLTEAYADYLKRLPTRYTPAAFGTWIGNFRGLQA